MRTKSTYNYIEKYLVEIQSKGRYSVTLKELKAKFEISEKAILQNIFRLKNKKQLAQVRKEFYVIIPPQYIDRGMVPPMLFINDMMNFLNRKYYVGLFSAAALHGASHQQPMEFQVMTQKPALRDIHNPKLAVSFFTKSEWNQNHIIDVKTESGYVKVSSAELTAFDMVRYHKRTGGLNRVITILEDLSEEIKPARLYKVAGTEKQSNTQRLAYLFDKINKKALADTLKKTMNERTKAVPLSLIHSNKAGKINEEWKIIENMTIDFS